MRDLDELEAFVTRYLKTLQSREVGLFSWNFELRQLSLEMIERLKKMKENS